jgi:hypothetical protein
MTKLSVDVTKNNAGRPEIERIYINNRLFDRLDYSYDDDGYLMSIESKKGKITHQQLYDAFTRKWIERISLVDLINLINRIALIDQITDIVNIGNIGNVGNLIWQPKSFLMNASFEQVDSNNFPVGWLSDPSGTYETPDVVAYGSISPHGRYFIKFYRKNNKFCYIHQPLALPIKVDWLQNFLIWTSGVPAIAGDANNKLHVDAYYTDGTDTEQTINATLTQTRTDLLSGLTSGKYIRAVSMWQDLNADAASYLTADDLLMVF